jgi:signal transduction histidine kinase/CheY-like chemotaxis protein/HPt (histidine-containing phosphotransfer) domain-containing protein
VERSSSPLAWSDLPRLAWLPLPLWVFDIGARRVVWANPAGLTLWDATTLDELRARDFSDMSEAAVTRFRASVTEMEAGAILREQWTLYPRGSPTTVAISRVAIRLQDGQLGSLQAAQPAAAVDAATLRGVEALHHTGVRVGLFSLDGAAQMLNPAALRTFGPLTSDVDAFAALFAAPEEAARTRAAVAAGATHSVETVLRTLDGPRWHGLDARGVTDPVTGAPLVLVNAREIEDRRAAEAALLQSVESQKRFLAAMSHEIRTPLNAVNGFVALLRSTELDEQQRRYADNAYVSAQHLLGLVSDVLDLSKLDARQLEMRPEDFDLEEVLLEALVIVSNRVRPGVELTYSMAEVDCLVHADPLRLKQILVNLLGNAAKFTERGHVRLVLARPRPVDDARIAVTIAVEDTGIGIPADRLGELFAPFRQAHGGAYGGTGLGLYLSRAFARLMAGDITVESAVGYGSRFLVQLEISRGPARAESVTFRGRRVLVLTGDAELSDLLSGGLRRAGAEVASPSAPTTEAALRACLGGPHPDVVLLELSFGGAAPALAGVLRDLCPQATLVGLHTPPGTVDAPVHGLLARPFTWNRLARLVAELGRPRGESHPARALEPYALRVLVVEDVEMNVALLQEAFRLWFKLGFTVARDGLEAVERVQGEAFDLVLMDLQMPRLDGIGATRAIRALGLDVPIVALTANAFSEDVAAAQAAGMNGYLTKPVQRADLERVLRRHAPASVRAPRSVPPRLSRLPRPPGVPRVAPEIRTAEAPPAREIARRYFAETFGPDRVERMFSLSVKGVRAQLEALEQAADDREKLTTALHALKGVVKYSGLVAVGERIAGMERRARAAGSHDAAEIARLRAELGGYVGPDLPSLEPRSS